MSSNIREIARKAGVSPSAVSLALRGTGRLSEETRKRIQEVAASMGYNPHPLVSRAFSLVRQPAAQRYRETFAFLTEYSLNPNMNPYPVYQERIQKGVFDQAAASGYKVEEFVISGKPAEHRRLSRILHARGVRGLVILPRLLNDHPRLFFDWPKFAAVEIGRTLWHPRNLHHIETADYNKMIEAIHLLKKVGYRRIGMAVEPEQNKHQRGIYYATYLLTQMRQPPRQRIPILAACGPWTEKTFRAWMKQYRPDVIFIQDTETVPGWIRKMGLSVPKDISIFYVNAQREEFSGLIRDYDTMGRSAVEMVALMLEKEQLGLPDKPRCWQIDERWQPGTTLSRSFAHLLAPDGSILPGQIRPHE